MSRRGTSPGKDARGLRLGGPAEAAGTAPTRELAQRFSGTDEVLLLWHPESDRVELFVCNLETGTGLQIEVAPSNAIDAFHHPYAYAARRENSHRVDRNKPTIVDG